jgi:hypothetical protein
MGGIWTTVADLAIWTWWLADAFPARDDVDDGPLRRASRREMQTAQRYVGMRSLRGARMSTSYGYGLRINHEPDRGVVISHSGGLPGYGSNMRWTPGGDVGVIALANVTYAPMTELAARIHDHVATQWTDPAPRRLDPEVVETARRLVELLDGWGRNGRLDDGGNDLFADNVEPDDAFERRVRDALTHGGLNLDEVVPINDARAKAVCTSAHGVRVSVTFSLAPFRPVRVQEYELEVDARDGDAATETD